MKKTREVNTVKTFKIILILLMFSMLPARSYSSTLGYLHISLIDGDVQINTEDTHEWVAASINMPLRDRDRIWVPEGLNSSYGTGHA